MVRTIRLMLMKFTLPPHNVPLPPAQAPNDNPVPQEDNRHVPAGLFAEAHRLMRRVQDRHIRFDEPHKRNL